MSEIVVYSGTNCPRCVEVKKYLQSKEIAFVEKNVREDTEALMFLKAQGFTSIPQVFKNGQYLCSWDNYKKVL